MSKSQTDNKHLILLGILCISLAILARPYITGHSSQTRPPVATRVPPGFEPARPAPANFLDRRRQEPAKDTSQTDDDSLSEIERLLR